MQHINVTFSSHSQIRPIRRANLVQEDVFDTLRLFSGYHCCSVPFYMMQILNNMHSYNLVRVD